MKIETACPGDRLKDKDGDDWERLYSGAVCTRTLGAMRGDRIAWPECSLREADDKFGPFAEIPRTPPAFGARCWRCSAEWNVDELRAGVTSGTIAVQGWTGRTFCRPACWDAYLESEGLK